MIYTRIPITSQLIGLWEVVLQTLAMSVIVVMWQRRPGRSWNLLMGTLTPLVVLMSLAGAFQPRPTLPRRRRGRS